MPDEDFTKVTFNLPTDDLEELKKLAAQRKTSVTNLLRQAIGLELFVEKREQEGAKLLLEEKNGSMQRLVRRQCIIGLIMAGNKWTAPCLDKGRVGFRTLPS